MVFEDLEYSLLFIFAFLLTLRTYSEFNPSVLLLGLLGRVYIPKYKTTLFNLKRVKRVDSFYWSKTRKESMTQQVYYLRSSKPARRIYFSSASKRSN